MQKSENKSNMRKEMKRWMEEEEEKIKQRKGIQVKKVRNKKD